MFRDDSLMLLGLEKFEAVSAPALEVGPVVREDAPTPDPLEPLGPISPEDEAARDDLAHLGLIKGREERDDLAVFGLARLSPRPRKWFGI